MEDERGRDAAFIKSPMSASNARVQSESVHRRVAEVAERLKSAGGDGAVVLAEGAEHHLWRAETRLVHIVRGVGGDHLAVRARPIRSLDHPPLRRGALQTILVRLLRLHCVRRPLIADIVEVPRYRTQVLISSVGAFRSLCNV